MRDATTRRYTHRALRAVAYAVGLGALGLAGHSRAQVVPTDAGPPPPSQAAQYDATVRAEAERADVRRSAAVVRSPEADAGLVHALRLEHAPFPAQRAPGAIVYVPPGLAPGDRLSVVVFVHGWDGCAAAVSSDVSVPCREGGPRRGSLGLVTAFRAAGVRALLVVPQMAFERRSSSPGQWSRTGMFRQFLQEVLDALATKVGSQQVDDIDRVMLAAHSGGYVTALTVLDKGGVPVDQVALFDAFYTGVPQVGQWVEGNVGRFDVAHPRPMRFVSVFRDSETGSASRALARRVQGAFEAVGRGGDVLLRARTVARLTEEEARRPVCLVRVPGDHQQAVRWNFTAMLRAANLPM
jgi:hypothetical protein